MNKKQFSHDNPMVRLHRIREIHRKARYLEKELNTSSMYLCPSGQIGKRKVVSIGVMSRGIRHPAEVFGQAISDALDPVKRPSKVKTLADMSSDEKAAIEKTYGAKIVDPDRLRDYLVVPSEFQICEEREKAVKLRRCRGEKVFHYTWLPRSVVKISNDGSLIQVRRDFAVRNKLIPIFRSLNLEISLKKK